MSTQGKHLKPTSGDVKFPPPLPRYRSLRIPILDEVLYDYMPKELVGMVDSYCSAAPIFHPERLVVDRKEQKDRRDICPHWWVTTPIFAKDTIYRDGKVITNPMFFSSPENLYIDEAKDRILCVGQDVAHTYKISTGQQDPEAFAVEAAHGMFSNGLVYDKSGNTVRVLNLLSNSSYDTGLPPSADFMGATLDWASRVIYETPCGFHLAIFPRDKEAIHFPPLLDLEVTAPDYVQIVGNYAILWMWQNAQKGLCVYSISSKSLLWSNFDLSVWGRAVLPGLVILIDTWKNIVALDLVTGTLLETYEGTDGITIHRDLFFKYGLLVEPFEFVVSE